MVILNGGSHKIFSKSFPSWEIYSNTIASNIHQEIYALYLLVSLDVCSTLTPKSGRHITRKLQTEIPYEYRYNNPQQSTSNMNPATHKKGYIPWPSGIYQRNTRLVSTYENPSITHHIKRIKDKTPHHHNKEAYDNIQDPFHYKNTN